MKLLILGHARHGKDTVCHLLHRNHCLSWQSSSEAACAAAVYPILKKMLGYQTIEECLNDRHNHREQWYELIRAYNHPDPARLARQVYAHHDILCGMRHTTELQAARTAGLFDYAIWVDRSQHQPPEPLSSCSVSHHDADYRLDNNGTRDELADRIDLMMGKLYSDQRRKQLAADQNRAWQEPAA